MNKTKIIERLLEAKAITIEEAVILLEKEVVGYPVNIPQQIYYPPVPYNPYPVWYQKPYEVTC